MNDFLRDKAIKFGIDYIKKNPEIVDNFCNEILSICENFELKESENRSVIMIFRNKLQKPQLSIIGIEKDTDRISSVKKSFTSENLFELLKKDKK